MKYFCRVDDYGITSKFAFEVAHAGYQNQESLHFAHLQLPVVVVKQEQNEIADKAAAKVVEITSTTVQKSFLKKKSKPSCRKNLIEKKSMIKKTRFELNQIKLETNDLHMKHINSV